MFFLCPIPSFPLPVLSEEYASILSFFLPALAWQHLDVSASIFNFLFGPFEYDIQLYNVLKENDSEWFKIV